MNMLKSNKFCGGFKTSLKYVLYLFKENEWHATIFTVYKRSSLWMEQNVGLCKSVFKTDVKLYLRNFLGTKIFYIYISKRT